jgi:hypothetical protein
MGNFLNIICDDLDYIEPEHYYSGNKWDGNEKIDIFLGDIFNFHGLTNYKRCTLKDALDNPKENYYYFIPCLLRLQWVLEKYGTIPLNEEFISAIKERPNINVIFYNNNECDKINSLDLLTQHVDKLKLSPKQFYFVNNNANLKYDKEQLGTEINVYSSRDLTINFCNIFSNYKTKFKPNKRFFFTYYNGTAKLHRYALLCLMKGNHMLDDSDWSLVYGDYFQKHYLRPNNVVDYNFYTPLFNLNQIVDYKDEIDYFGSISSKKSIFEENDPNRQNYDSINDESFTEGYVQIVTESHFGSEDVHITEKSFKPFYFYQIPVFVGSHLHVKRLKERYPNLDFFDDVVNHDEYDSIKDDAERLSAVYGIIKTLHKNKDSIIEFYCTNEDRFIRNRKMILKDVVKDKSDFNFFTDLINKRTSYYFFNAVYDDSLDFNNTEININNTEGILQFYDIKKQRFYHIDEIENINDRKLYYFVRHGRPLATVANLDGGLNFSKKLINSLKTKQNLYVVLLNEYEADFTNVLNVLESEIKKLGVNPEQFYVINNNFNLPLYKERLNSKINVHVINRLPTVNARTMSNFDHPFKPEKEFFFMSHCRVVKAHRYAIFMLLKKNGMLDDTDWSVLKGDMFIETKVKYSVGLDYQYYSPYFTKKELDDIKEEHDFFHSVRIKKSKYEEDFEFDMEGYFDSTKTFEMNAYSYSYVNIITETLFEESDILHITDKSFIPFYFHQIPIFVSTKNHVKILRDKFGFDMFDDLIDHSYDDIDDHKTRFDAVFKEITKLYKNKDSVIEFYKNNEERFVNNRDLIKKLADNKIDYDFFQSLIDD